jgi:rhodanese-related sulfurtransferase
LPVVSYVDKSLILHFISLEPAIWATLPLSKKRRVSIPWPPTHPHLPSFLLPTLAGVFDGLDKDATYLCYCQGGFRSAIAASFVRRAGLNVRDIVGGKTHMDKVADSAMFRNSKAE